MKALKLIFITTLITLPHIGRAATTCSKMNLTRCLDSVCAINASSNPAARCQYCGTADAGTPKTGVMRNLSLGASSTSTISEKELKSAPTDPGLRYVWATKQCLTKLKSCTTDDVSDTYDSLIEQSCKAAGISANFASARSGLSETKSKTACESKISACLISDTKCHNDFSKCEADAEFNDFFAQCSVQETGCDEHISAVRATLIATRDTTVKNKSALLESIVSSYQSARTKKLEDAREICTNNAGRDACIAIVCERSMANKCGADYPSEKSMATQLCKFYDTACAVLK